MLDRKVLTLDGCFLRERLWIRGWHTDLAIGDKAEYILGYQGRETQITRTRIKAQREFGGSGH